MTNEQTCTCRHTYTQHHPHDLGCLARMAGELCECTEFEPQTQEPK